MNEQEQTQVSANGRRGRQVKKTNGSTPQVPQHPPTGDKEAWKAHWEAQGQPWRTKPEIDIAQQKYLDERRAITPNLEEGVYPFKDIKLRRADVEWLLTTHENGRGPVDWSDERQRYRHGLDLRGANLSKVDLSGLPLSRLRGGLSWDDLTKRKTKADPVPAAIHLECAKLEGAHLEGADFYGAYMERANFINAKLQRAFIYKAHVEGANFLQADLKKANLSESHLEGSYIEAAHLDEVYLFNTHLEWAYLGDAHLEDATLLGAHLAGADLRDSHLEGAFLQDAHFEGKVLPADVVKHVSEELEIELFQEVAPPAVLTGVFFDSATKLSYAILGDSKFGYVSLADVNWGNTNLSLQDWSSMKMLGDEREARNSIDIEGERKGKQTRLFEYRSAVRAYRQLATALRAQGLNEDAARFAYRAQLMQRKVYLQSRKIWQYLGSLFLDLLSGYGYKVVRCFIAYFLVIGIFATIYHFLGTNPAWNESIVISMTAFHGRGFFPEQFKPGDPQAMVAAIEAFVGLLIEVTFIATLTQRLFGK